MCTDLASICLGITVLVGSPVAAQTVIERTQQVGSHSVRVRLEIGQFEPTRHTVKPLRPERHATSACYEIDGRTEPLGTDCDVPSSEIRRLSVTLDGIRLKIPVQLYRDCFNPRPGNDLAVRIADDARAAFVFFRGSDAGGSYDVVWVFRADGKHSRLSCAPSQCSDGGFITFDSFLARNRT